MEYLLGGLGVVLILGAVFIYRVISRNSCPSCYYPMHKCECKARACDHAEQFPAIWTQDGYIAKCKTCGEIVYLGDE
jgi:hypothetical protein